MLEDNFRMMFEARELKGRLAANLATATRLKEMGLLSNEQIASATNLSISKVRSLGKASRTRTRSTKAASTARRSRKAAPAGV